MADRAQYDLRLRQCAVLRRGRESVGLQQRALVRLHLCSADHPGLCLPALWPGWRKVPAGCTCRTWAQAWRAGAAKSWNAALSGADPWRDCHYPVRQVLPVTVIIDM